MRGRGIAIAAICAAALAVPAVSASRHDGETSTAASLAPTKTISVNEALERLNPHLEHLERALNDRFGSLMQRRLALAMRREGLSDSAQAGLMRDGDWSVGPFTGGAAVRIAHDFYLRNLGPLRLIRDRWRSKDTAALLPSAELEAVEAQMKAFYRAEPSILELIEQGIVLDARRAAVGWELKVKEDANHLGQVDGLGEQTPGFVLITPYLDSTVGASAQTNTYPLRLRMSALAAEADALETRYRAMHVQFTLPPGAPAPRVTAMPRPNAPSNDRLRE